MLQKILLILSFFLISITFGTRNNPIQYLFPKDRAQYVTQKSGILIRFTEMDPTEISNLNDFIQLKNSFGQILETTTKLCSDNKTVCCKPNQSFYSGDSIRVNIAPILNGHSLAYFDTTIVFFVSGHFYPYPKQKITDLPKKKSGLNNKKIRKTFDTPLVLNGVSIPTDFPFVEIFESNQPDTGYIFLNNWGDRQSYNMILDNTGAPVWYQKSQHDQRGFTLQDNGMLSMLARNDREEAIGYAIMDSTYTVIDTLKTQWGYQTDVHELQVLENGNYLMIGTRFEYINMQALINGGRPRVTVRETVIQEITSEHDLIFVWRAWDYYDVTKLEVDNPLSTYIRFPHMNAIDVDEDGHLLLSSRHLSEVTKINRQTGDIIWRLGGAYNDFTFTNDPLNGFKNQHDIRSLGNLRYTLFDNGNSRDPKVSRAVEYCLDTNSMTAELVWEYREDPDVYTPWMGNCQRLPNGNTLINWGDEELPKITEVTSEGQKAFEMNFCYPAQTYRVFRFPWNGKAVKPYLIAESGAEQVNLLFNHFGKGSDIAEYKIYGNLCSQEPQFKTSTKKPYISFDDLENGENYHFYVASIGQNGIESQKSNIETVYVHYKDDNNNQVLNGDFDQGKKYWQFYTKNEDYVDYAVENHQLKTHIKNALNDYEDIRFYQPGFELITGEEYILSFDAYSNIQMFVESRLGSPYSDDGYAGIGMLVLDEEVNHYEYKFTMLKSTDFDAELTFNCGRYQGTFYIDNVELYNTNELNINENINEKNWYQLLPNSPNPFSESTMIRYQVPENCCITIKIYNLLGELIHAKKNYDVPPGLNKYYFESANLNTGIYFYQLIANPSGGSKILYQKTRKMVLIK